MNSVEINKILRQIKSGEIDFATGSLLLISIGLTANEVQKLTSPEHLATLDKPKFIKL